MKTNKLNNLIIDCDLGFDCDDAGAIALACVAHNAGLVNLLAVTHCTGERGGAIGIDSILRYYGVSAGVGLSGNCRIDVKNFGKKFYSGMKFINGFNGYDPPPDFSKYLSVIEKEFKAKDKPYENACALISNKLSEAEDGSVTLLIIGQQNNLEELLLSNYPLVKKKIKRIVVMGGNFLPYREYFVFGEVCWTAEFNVLADTASAKFCSDLTDIPLEYLDFNQGVNVITGKTLLRDCKLNPAGRIYELTGAKERSSWDIVAALYAINPDSPDFAVSKRGRVQTEPGGRTVFHKGGGQHRLIYLVSSAAAAGERIEKLLEGGLKRW